jgi:hypothetical protein
MSISLSDICLICNGGVKIPEGTQFDYEKKSSLEIAPLVCI